MSTISETCWTPEVQCISALHERTSVQLDGQTKRPCWKQRTSQLCCTFQLFRDS